MLLINKIFKIVFLTIVLIGLPNCSTNYTKRGLSIPDVVQNDKANEHQYLATSGLNYLSQGDISAASKQFNHALQLNPRETDYHLLNAVAYHMEALNGNTAAYDLAKQGYEMAIKFDSYNWMALYLLGRLYLEQNQFAKAQNALAKALLLVGDEVIIIKDMAFASYRAGDPETAAAMIVRMEQLEVPFSLKDKQNAALIFAAVGEHIKSEYYLQQLSSKNEQGWRTPHITQRLNDWQFIHTSKPSFIKAGLNSVEPSYNVDEKLVEQAVKPIPLEQRMVVVDVVIIRTEESVGSIKGVNLLSGLQIQFGVPGTVDIPGVDAWSRGKERTEVTNFGQVVTNDVTDKIISAISIPALGYSLNIFNSHNQRNEILARPTIIAMADKTSEFFSGLEINAAAVSSSSVGGESIQIQKDIGVKLAVTAHFLDNNRIQLKVDAERTFLKTPNSDINFTFRLDTSKTKVNSNVVMSYGETLILSGMSEKETQTDRDGVPILQDIPIVQYFFSKLRDDLFQKTILILITPRHPQYVYQPETVRADYLNSLPEDERPLASLKSRYSDWFKPYPNWASTFNHMQQNKLYREFRTGDVQLEEWSDNHKLLGRLKESLDFLWY